MGGPINVMNYSCCALLRGVPPTLCILSILILADVISVYALHRRGLKPPASKTVRPVGSNGRFRFVKKKGDVFQTRRVACHGFTKASCSGKRFGSAAAENASCARIADAV